MKAAHEMTLPGKPVSPVAGHPSLRWRRWLPPMLLALCLALVWLLGIAHYLSFNSIAGTREAFRSFVESHLAISIVIYMFAYLVVTALLLPGAALLTVLGGFLFGWLAAGAATVLAASIGATLVFSVARSSLGNDLIERCGKLARNVSEGFTKDAFNYLLFLRLVPLFPFFVVNIAPALCRVKVRTFFIATLLGIIPGTFAYAILGSGLDSIIDTQTRGYEACTAAHGSGGCSFELTVASLLTPQLVTGLLILGIVALIPPLVKRIKLGKQL